MKPNCAQNTVTILSFLRTSHAIASRLLDINAKYKNYSQG